MFLQFAQVHNKYLPFFWQIIESKAFKNVSNVIEIQYGLK